jgi:hypothetical protein
MENLNKLSLETLTLAQKKLKLKVSEVAAILAAFEKYDAEHEVCIEEVVEDYYLSPCWIEGIYPKEYGFLVEVKFESRGWAADGGTCNLETEHEDYIRVEYKAPVRKPFTPNKAMAHAFAKAN